MQASDFLASETLANLIQTFSPLAWGIFAVLGLISVFALSVVVIKLVQFARARVGDARRPRAALAAWQGGDPAGALALCRQGRGLRLAVLEALFEQFQRQPGTAQMAQMAQMAAIQRGAEGLESLSRHMRGLEGVVQAAPMLGLLGTVVGMIEAFGRLAATSGAADPAQLAGGIWTALITTALGLTIAIVFYLISLWLEGRLTAEGHAIERLIGAALMAAPSAGTGAAPARDAQGQNVQGGHVQGGAVPQTASPFGAGAAAPPYAAHPSAPGAQPHQTAPHHPHPYPPHSYPPDPRQPGPERQAPAPRGVTVVQPMPGGLGQRTDPGLYAPAPHHPASRHPAGPPSDSPQAPSTDGPPPEGFRPRR